MGNGDTRRGTNNLLWLRRVTLHSDHLRTPRRFTSTQSHTTSGGSADVSGATTTADENTSTSFVTNYIIPKDENRLEASPGVLKPLLERRLTAAKRYYQATWKEAPPSAAGSAAHISASTSSGDENLSAFPLSRIRNVSIVAHVDHGKTTLTDAILRWAELLPKENVVGTFTDRLQVEKERGITIKAQTCSLLIRQKGKGGASSKSAQASEDEGLYLFNLVDTPGHADFQYEVSRSLHATEGALLLVDAGQGVEAQTLAQFHAVLDREGELVPVLTKMDAVASDARVLKTLVEMEDTMGILREEVLLTSAKQKQGLEAVFQAVIDRVPPPTGRVGYSDLSQLPIMHPDSAQRKAAEAALVPLRALVFDCWTAESGGLSSGVVSSSQPAALAFTPVRQDGFYCLIRVVDGTITPGTSVVLYHSRQRPRVEEVGIIHPTLHALPALTTGMVGYVFLKGVQKEEVRVGETLCTLPTPQYFFADKKKKTPPATGNRRETATSKAGATGKAENDKDEEVHNNDPTGKEKENIQTVVSPFEIRPIHGFKCTHPVVFAGLFPDDDNMITSLRESVELLCLNDPAVTVEKIQCQALGAGLQLGFLGLLHLQVFIERLMQEFGMPVLVTPPQVQYMYVGPNEDPQDVTKHKPLTVENWRWPHEGVGVYLEPVVHATVVTPREYFDSINQAALTTYRGEQEDMKGMDDGRMAVRYRMPLGDLARGFFSTVKSTSHGYASLDYDQPHYVEASVVKVDVIINKAKIGALSFICPQHEAASKSRQVLQSLKENLQRCSVDLPLQAVLGNKIIARETIKAYRKDVTAKIHAGDITRKQKKWNDQKKGKKRMAKRTVGTVTLDQEVLSAAMGATMLGS